MSLIRKLSLSTIVVYVSNSDCLDGTYGVNCTDTCGRCQDVYCNKANGLCPQGCQLWWAGGRCNMEIGKG